MLESVSDSKTATDPAIAWRQIATRDASADGLYVYAVRTTGIYCRPSCPSRRPAQRHVVLFATAAEAAQAGYRACKRCQPQAIQHPQAAVLEAACQFLRKQTGARPTLAQTAHAAGISPGALQRLFRRVLGLSPRQYHAAQRSQRFRQELTKSDPGPVRVTDAIYAAGYGSPSRVYGEAQPSLGMTPAQYRAQGAQQTIRYTTAPCALGQILVASTARGLCSVALGDREAALVAQLQREFPQASIVQDEAGLASALQQVLSQLSEHPRSAELPLDIRATAFQQRVWQALRQIPRGATISYAQLAASLGQPKAARAVARACAQNPIALLNPCHRVVGSDGSLTGYRWGLERKQRLLEAEKTQTR
jgi:AraC family transcriptional regulator of adaptative response/methylated-DNA-[protein]-cysteine methyltransferase